jgi:uncharacterized membrane protein HdeD (DUF308 family)
MATAPGHFGFSTSATPTELSKGHWVGVFVAGVIAVLVGCVAIAVPAAATVATAVFVGWMLIAGGLFLLVDAFSVGSVERGVAAVLAVAAGIYLLLAPLNGTVTLTFVLAVYFIAVGLMRLEIGWVSRGLQNAGLLMFNGALSLVIGLLIAFNLPNTASWAIGLLVGIDFLFIGLSTIAVALAARHAESVPGS